MRQVGRGVPRRAALAAAVAVVVAVAVALWAWVPATVPSYAEVRARYRPSEALLLDRDGRVLDAERLDFAARRLPWTVLAEVSPALVAAVLEGEDRRYWTHGAIDWRAVGGALRDLAVRHRRRGASTIAMQLATLIEGRHGAVTGIGAWGRKLSQVRVARGLAAHWSQAQILEAYLNLLEYRGELQGIAAAAEVLTGKAPAGLSVAESRVLAALLPDPAATPEGVAARACARAGATTAEASCVAIRAAAVAMLKSAPVAPATDEAARLAPELAHALLSTPGSTRRTTLDGALQREARAILRRRLGELAARNVRDGALLVVDNEHGEVLAYVGSAGPQSTAAAVDGVRAHRQAGSTLKPFLYGLAIERQTLTAASLLADSPVNLDTGTGTYIPEDYDHDFKGLVTVRTALGNSLNVPAVRALVLVGVEPFRRRLHELGYEGVTESGEFYGYSLALGSAEVSLWEQARAYRTLARGGLDSPLTLTPGEAPPSVRVLPAAVSFVIADILADPAARVLTFGLDSQLSTPFWSAAKTGTSKDMRDNWCIGFSSAYTVAVWVGNFEGDAMHEVSGVTGAAPVWRELMALLQRRHASTAPAPPAGVEAHRVSFHPAVEPPRREWLLGRGAPPTQEVTRAQAIARISGPANGMIIAIDPDIPERHQRVALTADGAEPGLRWRLDGQILGGASAPRLWAPTRGAHRLALEDAAGAVLDEVAFTVR